LLVVQVTVLVVYPFLGRGVPRSLFLYFSLLLILVAAGFASSRNRRTLFVVLVLGAPPFVMVLLEMADTWVHFSLNRPREVVTSLLVAMFFIQALIRVFLRIIRSREVTTDVIYSAVADYLLMGFAWASLYSLLETVHPGSFRLPGLEDGTAVTDKWELVYFSFVTLSTLGYGDMSPITSPARSLALLESIMGVMYVAIIVARLASLYHKPTTEDSP